MSALAALPLALAGMALNALSMDRHARQAELARKPRWLRAGGWALIALSLAGALLAPNWRFALVEWIGLVGAAAAGVVLLLHYRPRLLLPATAAAFALGAAILSRELLV